MMKAVYIVLKDKAITVVNFPLGLRDEITFFIKN